MLTVLEYLLFGVAFFEGRFLTKKKLFVRKQKNDAVNNNNDKRRITYNLNNFFSRNRITSH